MKSMDLLPPKGLDCKNVLNQDPNAIGPVRQRAVESHEDQHGKSNGRSTSCHDIQECRDHTDSKQEEDMD